MVLEIPGAEDIFLFQRDSRRQPIADKVIYKPARTQDIILASDGTGDYEDIHKAVASLKEGESLFIKAGTYEITGSLTIPVDNVIIRGQSFNSVIKASSGHTGTDMIKLISRENVLFCDFKLDGTSDDNCGFDVDSSSYIIFRNLIFENFASEVCIELEGDRFMVSGCIVIDTPDNFIYGYDCSNSQFINNMMESSINAAIRIGGDSDNNLIMGNNVYEIEIEDNTCNKNIIIANLADNAISDSGTDTIEEHNQIY